MQNQGNLQPQTNTSNNEANDDNQTMDNLTISDNNETTTVDMMLQDPANLTGIFL